MAHPEWDDVYFSASDRQQARYAASNSTSGPAADIGSYPNAVQNNGSVNNYPGNYGEASTPNSNAGQSSVDYVNPNYRSSGSTSYSATSAGNNSPSSASGGTTYVTNNYYDTDNYYRSSNFRNYGFSPYSTIGLGYGFGGWNSGWNIGFGYNSRMGWYGPSVGYSFGWGWPGYGYNNCGWNMGYGWGSPWAYNGFYDPFWGPSWRYNSWAYSPYFYGSPYGSPYYSPFYGPVYYGPNGSNDHASVPRQTNRPSANMSGNINPNMVSTPAGSDASSGSGRRNQGASVNPGGQPTAPDNSSNPTRQSNPDPNAGLFRPTQGETPDRYISRTKPEDYAPNRSASPDRRNTDADNSIFRQNSGTNSQRSETPFNPNPGTDRRFSGDNPANAVPPPVDRNQRNEVFRNDNNDRRTNSFWGNDNGNRNSDNNFFHNDRPAGGRNNSDLFRGGGNMGGGNFGGGNRGGGSFSPPSGGRRRGM